VNRLTTAQAVEPEPPRQTTVWRILVGAQLTVATVIILSIAAIFLIGLFGSLFVQRGI